MTAPVPPLTIRYFAWVREHVGRGQETFNLPPSVQTISALIAHLAARGDGYARAFARPEVIRAAIDQTHVRSDASLAGAREVAFFPPVTGG